MSRRLVLVVVTSALAFAACDKKPAPSEVTLPEFDPSKKKPPAAKPPEQPKAEEKPVDDGKTRVTLRWKVEKDRPVAVQAKLGPAKGPAVDPSALAAGKAAAEIDASLSGSASGTTVMAALDRVPEGDLVVRAQVQGAKASGSSLGAGTSALQKEGKIRATVSGRGFITSELDRDERNVLALMLELPSDPVAVGDVWRTSVKLVSPPEAFVTKDEARVNQVKLAALENDVATIEYVVAESQTGSLQEGKEIRPATLASAFLGRGKFNVAEGRWMSFEGRAVTTGTGALKADADERFSVSTGGTVSPELLKDPPPKVVQGEDMEGDDHGDDEGDEDAPTKPAAGKKDAKRRGK